MNCQWEPFEDKFKCGLCGFVVSRNTIRKNCTSFKEVKKEPPGLIQQAVNFGKATINHLAHGIKHCTEEQKQDRYNKCSKNMCGLFRPHGDGGVCAHDECGCFIRSNGKFMDKLSWADSKCPEGYWGPIEEKDE